MITERVETARAYYRTIDDEYAEYATLLIPKFVHERYDRTLEGRGRFIHFMREERPITDTTHEVNTIYSGVNDKDVA
ncbi:MAG: nuclear transport factor 2 family protein, partial [Halobacteriaceae archaeon]